MKQQNSIRILPLAPLLVPGAAAVERACFSLPWSEAGFLSELQKEGARALRPSPPPGRSSAGPVWNRSAAREASPTSPFCPSSAARGTGEALTRALLAAARELAASTACCWRCGPPTRRPSPSMKSSAFPRWGCAPAFMRRRARTR